MKTQAWDTLRRTRSLFLQVAQKEWWSTDLVTWVSELQVQIVFFMVIYRHTPLVGNWNFDQILIFTCGTLLLDAVNMTPFSNNMW